MQISKSIAIFKLILVLFALYLLIGLLYWILQGLTFYSTSLFVIEWIKWGFIPFFTADIILFVFIYKEYLTKEPFTLDNFKAFDRLNSYRSNPQRFLSDVLLNSLVFSTILLIIDVARVVLTTKIGYRIVVSGGIYVCIIFLTLLGISIMYKKKLVLFLNNCMLYTSVIANVLFPMFYIFGLIGIYFVFRYVPWFFADPFTTFIDYPFLRASWLNSSLNFKDFDLGWFMIKISFSVIGSLLFVISFIQLVYYLKTSKGLIRKGIYSVIRHPQNLGIILIGLQTFFPSNTEIVMSDIVAWVQFVFIMVIYSDIEDQLLSKKYPDEYDHYHRSTGFLFPRIFKRKSKHLEHSKRFNRTRKYLLLTIVYIVIMVLLFWCFLLFPFVSGEGTF